MSKFKYKKGIQAVNLLAQLSGGAESKMKIIKILWLAERMHLRRHGRPITFDTYYALPHGPVPSATLDLINGNFDWMDERAVVYRNEYISLSSDNNALLTSEKQPDLNVLSESDEQALREAFAVLRQNSAADLRDLSHRYPEWAKWENAIATAGQPSSYKMDFMDAFSGGDAGSGLQGEDDEEVLSANREQYAFVESVRNLLC